MATKILVFSDVHLDATTAGMSRWDDLCAALDEVYRAVVEEKVDLVVFAGDWCDPGVKASRCIGRLVYEAMRYRQAGIPFRALVGNHDTIEDGHGSHVLLPLSGLSCIAGSGVGLSPEIGVWDEPCVERICDVDFLALPYTPRSRAYDPDEVVEKLANHMRGEHKIVVGHLNIEGIGPGSETTDMPRGREVFWPLDALKKHLPDALLVGGHYHKRQTFAGVEVVGSLEALSFGEERDGDKGWLIVELGGSDEETKPKRKRAPRRKKRATAADD